MCGTNSLELVATNKWQTVTVNNFPYFSMISGQRSYSECYYRIKVPDYVWRDGSKINIMVSQAQDVNIVIY